MWASRSGVHQIHWSSGRAAEVNAEPEAVLHGRRLPGQDWQTSTSEELQGMQVDGSQETSPGPRAKELQLGPGTLYQLARAERIPRA